MVKKILQVVPNMQQGGIENYIMNLYRNIDRDLVQFDFLTHYSGEYFFDQEIYALGGHIYKIPLMENKANMFKYVRSLSALLSHHKFDVIHGHMATTAYIYMKIAKSHGINNRIIHAHEDSYIHNIRGYIRKYLIQNSYHDATVRLACSNTAGNYYFGKHGFEIIHNAIDVNRFTYSDRSRKDVRKEFNIDETQMVLCHVGRFCLQKNHQKLINIFQSLKKINNKAVLFLIGKGETEADIRKMVHDLSLEDSVYFLGNTAEPEKYYCASDLFILPSKFEGLPLTGIEAQTNGLPCVFSDAVTREVDISGCNEFVSLSAAPELWADRIQHLYLNSPDDRMLWVQDVCEAGYDIAANAEHLQSLYLNM